MIPVDQSEDKMTYLYRSNRHSVALQRFQIPGQILLQMLEHQKQHQLALALRPLSMAHVQQPENRLHIVYISTLPVIIHSLNNVRMLECVQLLQQGNLSQRGHRHAVLGERHANLLQSHDAARIGQIACLVHGSVRTCTHVFLI